MKILHHSLLCRDFFVMEITNVLYMKYKNKLCDKHVLKPEEIYQRKIPEEMSGKSEITNMEKTRMHSSRMRTARLLTVSQGVYLPGGVLPDGVPARGVYLPRYLRPCEQNDRQVQKYALPQTSFAGGNNAILQKWGEIRRILSKEYWEHSDVIRRIPT